MVVPDHASQRSKRLKTVCQMLQEILWALCLVAQLMPTVRQINAFAIGALIQMANTKVARPAPQIKM